MTNAIAARLAAGFANKIRDDVTRAQVVDDRAALVLRHLQEILREQRGDDVAAEHLARLVEEDAAIGVTVEARAEVRLRLGHLLFQCVEVLLEERSRLLN